MPNHNIAPAQGHRLAAHITVVEPMGATIASSRYPHNATVEVGRQVCTEVAGVVASTIDEGGFSTAQELTPDEVHARRTNDPSVMPDHAFAV